MRFLAFALLLVTCVSALAQAYPAKPIKIVVPFPAGGIADLYGRLLGARLSEPWGQPIVIENRTGAGGNIGADAVAKSAPDGYTLVLCNVGSHGIGPSLYKNPGYDALKDVTYLGMIGVTPNVMVVFREPVEVRLLGVSTRKMKRLAVRLAAPEEFLTAMSASGE